MNNSTNLGYPLRAAGSFHPGTNSYMQMVACNLGNLIASLPPQTTPCGPDGFPNKDKYLSVSERKEQRKRNNGEGITDENLNKNDVQKNEMFELEWAARYRINESSRRNEMLKQFVQEGFQQLGKDTARRIAEDQFQQKTVETEADRAEHMRDFETMWRWCDDTLWRPKLNQPERAVFDSLKTDTERDAFRIVWSFNAYATSNDLDDFPIVQQSLANRLGLTRQGASKLIKRFSRCGIIARTQEYIPHLKAARYAWLVGSPVRSPSSSKSPPPTAEAKQPPKGEARDANSLSPASVGDLHCDLPTKPIEPNDRSKWFGEQIIALLALTGPLSPADLRQKIIGYDQHSEACEQLLRRYLLQLAIDFDADGRYQIGPEKQHFKLLAAQHLLRRLAIGGMADSDQHYESLSSHFGIDIDDFKRARDALLELGVLIRTESNRLKTCRGCEAC